MRQDMRPQLWTILFCTAAFVAMLVADCLRVVGLRGEPVATFCVVSAAILGSLLYLEPIVEKRRALKLARQKAQMMRKDGRRDDEASGNDPEPR
jgi:hypothetical protein